MDGVREDFGEDEVVPYCDGAVKSDGEGVGVSLRFRPKEDTGVHALRYTSSSFTHLGGEFVC